MDVVTYFNNDFLCNLSYMTILQLIKEQNKFIFCGVSFNNKNKHFTPDT